MAARLSALRTGCTLPPGFFIFKDSWYSFLLKAESTPGPVQLEGLGQFKKIHLIGTWTHDLPACSIVPFFFNSVLWGYWHCGHSWPIVPASGDNEDDCGEVDGMYIGRGNRSSRRKPAPAPLLPITKSHMTRPSFEPRPPRWEAGV
jgi:hypothetical protein